MRYHPELGPVPSVGLELEVVTFEPSSAAAESRVVQKLVSAGYMPDTVYSPNNGYTYFGGGLAQHDYHCGCETCRRITTTMSYPLQVALQRDASLTKYGGEFITSPFPASHEFIDDAEEVFAIIGKTAVWTLDLLNEHGSSASPGLHIHTYSAGLDERFGTGKTGFVDPFTQTQTVDKVQLNRFIATMYAFIPELLNLASANNFGYKRGLEYRLPINEPFNHHAFIAVSGRGDTRIPFRLEFRFWEIPYGDTEYLRSVIYFTSALAQFVLRPKALKR